MDRPFQAYEGAEPYVFVCYSHNDRELVYPEIIRLKEAGVRIWYDEGISPGSEWSDTLANHIAGSTVFLYFVTPRSAVSEHCRREVNFALEQLCGILAVHLEPTKLPGGLQLTLSNRQAILKYDEPPTVYEAKLAWAIRDAENHRLQESPTSTLEIGAWTLDVGAQHLTRGDETHELDPKALSVLLHLIDRAPEVVSRQGLIDRTWPDVVVGENVLDQAIAKVRRALGDNPRRPEYVETLPRRGYRIIAPLATAAAPADEAHVSADVARPEPMRRSRRLAISWRTGASLALVAAIGIVVWFVSRPAPKPPALDRSLSVLPLSVLGEDSHAPTFAVALTEELRAIVTGYPELRTVSVSESIGSGELSGFSSYLVGGNVQRLGKQLLLRVHLIRADDRYSVWGKTFEYPAANEMPDPGEIATTVGRFIRLQLVQDQQCESVHRSSSSNEAAAAYCAALAERYRLNQGGDLDLALELSNAQRAIALDPNIADAYRIVAENYTVLSFLGLRDWREVKAEAHRALEKGLVLAPNDPRLLHVRGRLLGHLELDRPGANASFHASLASDPQHPNAYQNYAELGTFLLAEGKVNDALEHYRRALRIHDSDASLYTLYAAALWVAGQNRDAIRVCDAGLRLVEVGWARAWLLIVKAIAYHALGESDHAIAMIDDALTTAGPNYKFLVASSLAVVGRTDEARQLVDQMVAVDDPLIEAVVLTYAALGDERAFEWIHKGIDRHIATVVNSLRASPSYSSLRQDPRWNEVIANLEQEEARGQNSGLAPF